MKQKISLVLSGGGARGIVHIGVIEELERQGYEITSIAGTSMGALIGGFYAMGKMQELKAFLCSLTKTKMLEYVDLTLSVQGLIKGDKLFKVMKKFAEDAKIEDLKIKYTATAVDIVNNREIVFREGSVFEAIRASISIPTVFMPVPKKGGMLVDGGLMNNIPVSNVIRQKDDLLVVVDTNAAIPFDVKTGYKNPQKIKKNPYQQILKKFKITKKNEDKINYFELANRSINLLINGMAELRLAEHSPDLLIRFSEKMCGIFEFYKAQELIKIGHFVTKRKLKKMLDFSIKN